MNEQVSKETNEYKDKNIDELLHLYTTTSLIKVNATIKVFTINRSILESCKFRTEACEDCYMNKIYKTYTNTMNAQYDKNLEINWKNFNGDILHAINSKKNIKIKKFRFASSGECINTIDDIAKIKDICNKNKDIKFWLPTRSFRNYFLRKIIEKYLFSIKNLRIYASIDYTTNKDLYLELKNSGWCFMYYSDNNLKNYFNDKMIKCNKTWYKEKNITCNNCNICWNSNKKIVYLKKH